MFSSSSSPSSLKIRALYWSKSVLGAHRPDEDAISASDDDVTFAGGPVPPTEGVLQGLATPIPTPIDGPIDEPIDEPQIPESGSKLASSDLETQSSATESEVPMPLPMVLPQMLAEAEAVDQMPVSTSG